MNNVIKRELDKVKVLLPEYDDNTTHLYIPKKEVEDVISEIRNASSTEIEIDGEGDGEDKPIYDSQWLYSSV